jgi:hypothetical protein
MAATSPIPSDSDAIELTTDPGTGRKRFLLSEIFQNWLLELTTRVDATPESIVRLPRLTNQAAAIAATPLALPESTSGLYRVTVYARKTQAATTSSDLTVTIQATDGGVACPQSTPTNSVNTTAAVISQSFLVRRDQATAITYETAYASVGGTVMKYALDVEVEAL